MSEAVSELGTGLIYRRPAWIDPKWTPLPDGWPPKIIQRLRRNGVETWQQLEKLTEADALKWPGVGRDVLSVIRALCEEADRVLHTTVRYGGPTPDPRMVMPVHIHLLPGESKSGVYFIRSAPFIKIGISGNVCRRLHGLAHSNPHDLVGLAWIMAGDEAAGIEATLHARFAAHRYRGEWFREHPALYEYIRAHADPWPV